jgi:hypothetical protein
MKEVGLKNKTRKSNKNKKKIMKKERHKKELRRM